MKKRAKEMMGTDRSPEPIRTLEGDPVLELVGLGKELWDDENPDDYVRGLRAGWD